jgi:hypothetical protein
MEDAFISWSQRERAPYMHLSLLKARRPCMDRQQHPGKKD